jgi:light-independent protochlorophyllide reductase B subunit
VAETEMGFKVVGLGTYSREFARDIRAAAKDYGVEPLITDDYLEVEQAIIEATPELVLGTQMERHIAKRLGIGCAVISAPVHVQDFPARYSPQMGFEGANVLFDTWVHPLTMGLEEHLLACSATTSSSPTPMARRTMAMRQRARRQRRRRRLLTRPFRMPRQHTHGQLRRFGDRLDGRS